MEDKNKKVFETGLEWLANQIVQNEFAIAKSNQEADWMDFESAIDMLEMKRNEKDYDWASDVFIPEFPSIVLSDAAGWVSQYFQSRDFADVYLEGDRPQDEKVCKATKKLINKSLNNQGIHYYQKFVRMRMINALAGYVWLKCWWDFKAVNVQDGEEEVELEIDISGKPIKDRLTQTPLTQLKPRFKEKIIVDRFNFDVIDPRNVFTDNKYCYSAQEKDWVIIRSQTTYEDLVTKQEENAYFNLKKVCHLNKGSANETDTSKETSNKDDQWQWTTREPYGYFDLLERFGKEWAVVKTRDAAGRPLTIEPGTDQSGDILDDAELLEVITAVVVKGSNSVVIRFQPTPFIDADGIPYKPLIRGLCYVHPTKDVGMSTGKYLREQQKAINDTFNRSQDRVALATTPTFKGRKYSLEDNDTLYIEPEHIIELDDPTGDLVPLEISENIEGALAQINMLSMGMQKIEPSPVMVPPGKGKATATAVANVQNNVNARASYKNMTVEFTLLTELYNMLIQMANMFMHEETAKEILGQDVYYFDPRTDYTYEPVSSNIELENNKYKKIQMIDQLIGRIVNVQNPKVPAIINKLLSMVFRYLGEEFQEFERVMLDEDQGAKPGGKAPKDAKEAPTSNGQGFDMSNAEQATRSMSQGA